MTIDEQIAALNKLIVNERQRLVRSGATKISDKAQYDNLVAEQQRFTELRATKGGDYDMELSSFIIKPAIQSPIPSRVASSRAVSSDAGERSRLFAAKKQAPSLDEPQRQLRAGSY